MINLITNLDYRVLNYIDWAVIMLVAFSVIFGAFRGFVLSFMSLLGWVAAIVISCKYSYLMRKFLAEYISAEPVLSLVSYSAFLLVMLILFAMVNSAVAVATVGMRGGIFDRMFGALFGLFRGALIASLLFACVDAGFKMIAMNESDLGESEVSFVPESVRGAQSYRLLQIGQAVLLELVPIDIDNELRSMGRILGQ